MNSVDERQISTPGRSARPLYRFARALARLLFTMRSVRLLWADRVPPKGRTLLVVNAPTTPLTVFLLTAAFEQPLQWILDDAKFKGFSGRVLAAGFGAAMINGAPGAESQVLARCQSACLAGSVIAFFAANRNEKGGDAADSMLSAARPAIEMAKIAPESNDFAVHFVDVFTGHRVGGVGAEDLIRVAAPVYPREFLYRADGDVAAAARSLNSALEDIQGSSPFRLFEPELANLLCDLEEILRLDLDEDWSKLPGWRQDVNQFDLSGLVDGWAGRANVVDPAAVMALQATVEKFRKSRQSWAVRQFASDAAKAWLGSGIGRARIWLETILGFAVALYGAANHLVAGAICAFLRKLERHADSAASGKWIAGSIGILCGYTIQILLCSHLFGRAAAGYYALTLPVTGAYLWRYVWLLRNRSRAALTALLVPFSKRTMVRARRAVVSELDRRMAEAAASAGARSAGA